MRQGKLTASFSNTRVVLSMPGYDGRPHDELDENRNSLCPLNLLIGISLQECYNS